MSRQIQAVYEKGVLRPLSPLDLAENQVVSVVVSDTQEECQLSASRLDLDFLEWVRKEAEKLPPPPGREEIRRLLSTIPGSLTDDFFAEREEV